MFDLNSSEKTPPLGPKLVIIDLISSLMMCFSVFTGITMFVVITMLLICALNLTITNRLLIAAVPWGVVTPIILLSALVFCYEALGANYSFGLNHGRGDASIVITIAMPLIVALFLAFSPKSISNGFYVSIQVFTLFWCVNNYVFYNDIVIARQFLFYSPVVGVQVYNSPGIINLSLISALAYSLQSKNNTTVFLVFLACIISALIVVNRTGLIGGVIALIGYAFINKKKHKYAFLIFFFISLGAIYFSFHSSDVNSIVDIAFNRFETEGLKSNRWEHNLNAFKSILNGDYLFGGMYPNTQFEVTYWFHNLIFDSYARSGVLGFIISIFCMLFVFVIMSRRNKFCFLAVSLIMIIWLTGIPFEGIFYGELSIPFALAIRVIINSYNESITPTALTANIYR